MGYSTWSDGVAGDAAESFTFAVGAGQRITVAVESRNDAAPDLAMELRGPAGNLLSSADGRGAGEPEVIQSAGPTTAGTHTVDVRAVAGRGEFQLTVFLNAAAESESYAGGVNDTPDAAQPIGGGFINIGDGVRAAAVSGRILDAVTVAGAREDFEAGVLGPAFATRVSNPTSTAGVGVQILTTDEATPRRLLWLTGDYNNGSGALVEAVWTVNLSGVDDATLSFTANRSRSDASPFAGDFTGHYNADGVAISGNGIDWHPVLNLADTSRDQRYTIDLDAEAAAAGMPLSGNFRIKFQYYDDYVFGGSGALFDDLHVTASDEDWYAFPAAAGEPLSLQANVPGGSLQLFDPAGRLVAAGTPAAGLRGLAIRDFGAPADGTYLARVAAPAATRYALGVLRGASLNLGSHYLDRPADAQDIRETGRVAGAASVNLGRLYGHVNSSYPALRGIVELDRTTGATLRTFPGYAAGVTTTPVGVLATAPLGDFGRQIVELNPDTGNVIRSIPLSAGQDAQAMAYFRGEIFLSSGHVLDYATGALKRVIQAPGTDMTATDTRLLGLARSNTKYALFEIDPATGQKAGLGEAFELTTPNKNVPEGIAAIGGELYVRLSTSPRIHVVDLETYREVRWFDQPMINTSPEYGFGGGGGPDGNRFYRVPVRAGDLLTVSTSTPVGGIGGDLLDPIVELYTPAGVLVASDDNGAGDGRNARLEHAAAHTGEYRVRLRAASGSGEFLLSVGGYTAGGETLRVVATDPGGGAVLSSAPSSVTVDFSAPLSAGTVQPADFTVDGRPAVAAVSVDADTVRFDLPALSAGRHVVRIAPGSVVGSAGSGVKEFVAEFTVAQVGPRVVSVSPAQGGERTPGPLTVEVVFDRPLAAGVLDGTDFALVGSNRGIQVPSSWAYDAGTNTLRANYADLPGDFAYTFTLYSGNGRFQGADGAALDGEWAQGAATGPSGNGSPGGSFELRFALQAAGAVTAPTDLVAFPISAGEIELQWTNDPRGPADPLNPDGVPVTPLGVRVERAEGEGTFTEIAVLPGSSKRYNDTSARPGAVYRYRLRFFVVDGQSPYSAEAAAAVLPPELTTPVKELPPMLPVTTTYAAAPTAVFALPGGGGLFLATSATPEGPAKPHLQLWKTDGTSAGTVLVKDVGQAGMRQELAVAGGLFYFTYTNVAGNASLWRSDGTGAGTFEVAPLFAVDFGSAVRPAVAGQAVVGGKLLFAVSRADRTYALYSSDGTAAGTSLVKSFPVWMHVRSMANVGGTLYFALGTDNSYALWKSDGTAAGTAVVRDDVLGGQYTPPSEIVDLGGVAYFMGRDAAHGMELWKSNGTSSGTALVKDVNPGPASSLMSELTVAGGTLYFAALTPETGAEVWKSDGTAGGTVLVKETFDGIFPQQWEGGPHELTPVGDRLAFITVRGNNQDNNRRMSLWVTDGTPAGTTMVVEQANRFDYGLSDLTAVGGTLFFNQIKQTGGYDLWRSDLTPAGTGRFAGFPSPAKNLASVGAWLTFSDGNQLWHSDGTEAGTAVISAIGGVPLPAHPDWLTNVNGVVYFTASTRYTSGHWVEEYGRELWKTDGTAQGTERLFAGSVSQLMNVNGTLFFSGADARGGQELWKTDGTVAGTVRVADLRSGALSSSPRLLAVANGRLFFAVTVGDPYYSSVAELWTTDGTEAGTTRLGTTTLRLDIVGEAVSYARRLYAVVGDRFYFRRDVGVGQADELWRTDGTDGGTERVPGVWSPQHLFDLNGTLLFTAVAEGSFSEQHGLWKVVPGAAASAAVEDIRVNMHSVTRLVKVGDAAFFSASDSLWRTDGTAAGTFRVWENWTGSPPAGEAPRRPAFITDVDGVAYFVTSEGNEPGSDGIRGGLWRSDGTAEGTVRVREFFAPLYAEPVFLLSVGGKLVYSDGVNLWRSDGTREGTVQVSRMHDGVGPFQGPAMFGGAAAVVVGDRLFFSAAKPGTQFSPDGSESPARDLRVATLLAPDAPAGLVVTDASSGASGITLAASGAYRLTWQDNARTETGFVVERSRRADFAVVDRTFFRAANSTSFVDTTAAGGGVYYYRVRAVNAGGDSGYSNAASLSPVAGRYVFYNRSAADGNDAAAGWADDAAVAGDKRALLPGRAASAANITSYSRGINGVMVDIAGLPSDVSLTAADFVLEVGSPGKWRPLSAAPSVSVRRGAGASGTDRVTLVLPDGAVLNTWLRVTVKAGSRTGLASSDVFYFGNLVGDVGGAGAPAVNATDLALTRANFGRTSAAALARYDFNRDGLINAADVQLVRVNQRRSLPLFTAPEMSAVGAFGSAVGDATTPPTRASTRPGRRGLLGDAQPELLS